MPPSEGYVEDTTDHKHGFLEPVGVFTPAAISPSTFLGMMGWLGLDLGFMW